MWFGPCVCVCVFLHKRDRKKERKREREREGASPNWKTEGQDFHFISYTGKGCWNSHN